ncbi:MAG: glycoside hydrolase family 3 C-terminal domain-containing protein, partial [Bifidobacteriaceae bacterium]|nr:glycoside hydrolase family 3 C-terminal domain-containing protein [Bifidobacteriaceae bacterium]
MRKPSKRWLALTTAIGLVLAAAPAQAWYPTEDPSPLETANAKLSMQTSLEGMVLLDNHNGVLPIAKTGNLALFGCGAMSTVKGGTGSGAVNNRASGNISARKGFEDAGYTITTSDAYWQALDGMDGVAANARCQTTETLTAEWAPSRNFKWQSEGLLNSQYTYPNPIYPDAALDADTVKPTAATDTAIYIVSRNSGEHWDRYNDKGDYLLSDTERANIKLIGQNYANVIFVINIGGIIDTKFVAEINQETRDPQNGDPIDAVFLMSQAGQGGGAALPMVLNGTETPSGKLTDTWAKNYAYYPAAATFSVNDYSDKTHLPPFPAEGDPSEAKYKQEDYSEGIYVGYRYFDSFYKTIATGTDRPEDVVVYPFGFGLSYTSFDIKTDSVTAKLDSDITVKATVKNTGKTYSGKEVVEVYASAPTGQIDKPYQELVGFGKTDNLAPGKQQQLSITFPASQLASYDKTQAGYVLEAGDYLIRVGNSSRNTAVAAKLHLAQRVVTEQLSNQFRGQEPAGQLTSNPANFYSYPTEQAEIAAAPVVDLAVGGFVTPNHASTVDQSVTIGASDPMFSVEGNKISASTTYLSTTPNNDWEGTGSAYQANTARGEQVSQVSTVVPGTTTPTLWDVYAGRISMNAFVAGLSVDELTHLVVGRSSTQAIAGSTVPSARGSAGFTTEAHEDLGIPSMSLPDGPAGLRLTASYTDQTDGHKEYQYTTAWPIAMMLAQSFNPQLIQAMGEAVGLEMDDFGATLWLAPAMNLHRDPLCGRNFEYYSEDPLVSGMTAAYITLGVQSRPGRGVTLKHFAANNSEAYRSKVNEIIGERAVRELYLKSFEIAVKMAQPMAIMSSYNQINGVGTYQDYDLLTDVLRGEWGFDGLVMTDWSSVIRGGGTFLATQYAGNDLIMPGNNRYQDIASLVKPVPPTNFDIFGLPVVGAVLADTDTNPPGNAANPSTTQNWQVLRSGFTEMISATPADPSQGYSWYTYDPVSNFRPSASGAVTFSRDVTSVNGQTTSAIPTALPSSNATTKATLNNVDEAYQLVQRLIGPVDPSDPWTSLLDSTAKAAVTVSDVVDDGAVPPAVTSYRVTVRGDYQPASLRLGDLQRNAANILRVTMKSQPFQFLSDAKSVAGVDVKPYSQTFNNLITYNRSDKGQVVDQPAPSPTTSQPSQTPSGTASTQP